jgi:hypothetical protein
MLDEILEGLTLLILDLEPVTLITLTLSRQAYMQGLAIPRIIYREPFGLLLLPPLLLDIKALPGP